MLVGECVCVVQEKDANNTCGALANFYHTILIPIADKSIMRVDALIFCNKKLKQELFKERSDTNQYLGSDRLFCSRVILTSIITKRIQHHKQTFVTTFQPEERAFIKLHTSLRTQGIIVPLGTDDHRSQLKHRSLCER